MAGFGFAFGQNAEAWTGAGQELVTEKTSSDREGADARQLQSESPLQNYRHPSNSTMSTTHGFHHLYKNTRAIKVLSTWASKGVYSHKLLLTTPEATETSADAKEEVGTRMLHSDWLLHVTVHLMVIGQG